MLPLYVNGLNLFAASWPFEQSNERKMILIQLSGGNDGLNSVIPIEDYDRLQLVRGPIMVPEKKLITVDKETALHPALAGLGNLYREGMIGIALAVGYPNPNRSHFRSMDIVTSGSPSNEIWQTGWLGRNREQKHLPDQSQSNHPYAITMGYAVSSACQGRVTNFSTLLVDPWSSVRIPDENLTTNDDFKRHREEVEYVRNTIQQTRKYGEAIQGAVTRGSNTRDYPETDLGHQLKTIARLISGGLKTQIYIANLSGFDTHADQVEPGSEGLRGKHPHLLTDLSESIQAFMLDLKRQKLDQEVFGMTFSEFGRQIKANQSGGTDHGDASALFYFGGSIQARIIGSHPVIPHEVPDQAGIPMGIDIRDVYKTILEDWFQSEVSKNMKAGPGYNDLPIFK